MSLRTCLIGAVRTARSFSRVVLSLAALALASGCAQREMRAQAAALAEAGARLEAETAEFAAARSAVVRLRQRNLVERRQQIAEQGQFNARTIHFWKIAADPERAKRLALFDGLVAASAAAAAVRDRPDEWEESVLARTHALTIDRAALRRFVQQLLVLSRPPRFLDSARFFVEYGAVVGKQVEGGLKEVQATVKAAGAGAAATGDLAASGGDRPTTDPNEPRPGEGRPGEVRAPVRYTPP